MDDTEEMLWVKVKTPNSFLLSVIYRPTYSKLLNEDNKLEDKIQQAISISKNIIITGDFNIDLSDPISPNIDKLKNILKSNGFTQHIAKPTRINHNNFKSSILDHIWIYNETIELESSGTFYGISDHFGIYTKLKMKTPKPVPKKITFRDYKNFDPEKFNDEISKALCESNIENDIGNENLNTATETLTKIISKAAEKHAPLVTKIIREKKDPPWYNKDIKERIKSKNLLLQDFYISRHPSLKKRLRRENNRLTYLKYNAKSSWIIKQIEKAENDISELWKLLNFLTNKRKPEPIEPDNINQEKANKYNRFFATVGINIQKSLSNTSQSTNPKTFPKYKGPKFKFKAIAPKYIKKLINEINPKVATGIDGIPSKLIKACKNSISPFICKLINLGYSINKFPDSLKIAIIKPIFKSEDHDDISNNGPISIFSIISG